jgi:hypothetical protein
MEHYYSLEGLNENSHIMYDFRYDGVAHKTNLKIDLNCMACSKTGPKGKECDEVDCYIAFS